MNQTATAQKITVDIPLELEYEVHDTEEFQKAGHFLPAMRKKDVFGHPDFKSDQPIGESVHILRLPHPQDPNESILRKVGDSYESALAQFREEFPRAVAGLWNAVYIQRLQTEEKPVGMKRKRGAAK